MERKCSPGLLGSKTSCQPRQRNVTIEIPLPGRGENSIRGLKFRPPPFPFVSACGSTQTDRMQRNIVLTTHEAFTRYIAIKFSRPCYPLHHCDLVSALRDYSFSGVAGNAPSCHPSCLDQCHAYLASVSTAVSLPSPKKRPHPSSLCLFSLICVFLFRLPKVKKSQKHTTAGIRQWSPT